MADRTKRMRFCVAVSDEGEATVGITEEEALDNLACVGYERVRTTWVVATVRLPDEPDEVEAEPVESEHGEEPRRD